MEQLTACSNAGAAVAQAVALGEALAAHGTYHVTCTRADGSIAWTDAIDNLVTTQGKNDLLDKYLAGSGYTAAWYIGLIGASGYTGVAAGDTAASHAGWTEDQNYSQGTRPAAAWSAAAAGTKALSAGLAFSVSGSTTIKGCFLASSSTKGGTAGILYSAGLFTNGDKPVGNGDSLTVSYQASV